MIKNLLVVLMSLMTYFNFGQDKQEITKGYYIGQIEENGRTNFYALEVDKNGLMYQINLTESEDYETSGIVVAERKECGFKSTTSKGQITTLEWIDVGGVWSETQKFIITKIDENSLRVLHIRYVVNKGSETESWFYGGVGFFFRSDKIKNKYGKF